jgi:hypothetical protein
MRTLVEPLVTLADGHLSATTRDKLARDEASVNVYPNAYGAFVYVGSPCYAMPEEPDLARLFSLAERAGIAWLQFDPVGATIDGLEVYPA